MNERQIIEFCIRNKITVNQFFILYLTKRRWEGFRQEFVEYTSLFPWSQEEMKDLVARKMVVAPHWDPDTEITPINIALPEEGDEAEFIFDDKTMGEELYKSYPATFPLSGGGSFISRTGKSKEEIIEKYLNKIGRDTEKHNHVMAQLAKYTRLVAAGKINGHKLWDWIENEMWDTIASIEPTVNEFKDDI